VYEHETVKQRQAKVTALFRSFCCKHCTESLLGRQGALKGKVGVCERMHCVEDIFVTGQVALDLGIPDSKLKTSEKQECAVGQHYVIGGPG